MKSSNEIKAGQVWITKEGYYCLIIHDYHFHAVRDNHSLKMLWVDGHYGWTSSDILERLQELTDHTPGEFFNCAPLLKKVSAKGSKAL